MKKTLIITGLVLLLILSVLGSLQKPPSFSTFSSEREGMKAFYLLLEQEGGGVERWRHPFTDLDDSKGNVLFLIAPPSMGGEEALLEWVGKGNTLVLLDGAKAATGKLRKGLGIKSVRLPTVGFEELLGGEATLTVQCPPDLVECRGVEAIKHSGSVNLELPSEAIVLSDPPSLFTKRHGTGRVWYLPDASLASNYFLDRFDHLRLLYQIARSGKRVLFDEFHHGYTAPVGEMSRDQLTTVILFISYLSFILLVITLSRAVRFGPARGRGVVEPSRQSEFIDVLSLLYEEHKAYEVLHSYLEGWKVRVEHGFGIHRGYSNDERLQKLRGRGVIDAQGEEKVREALRDIQSGLKLERGVQVIEEIFHQVPEPRAI